MMVIPVGDADVPRTEGVMLIPACDNVTLVSSGAGVADAAAMGVAVPPLIRVA
jgi:hypothetical protein